MGKAVIFVDNISKSFHIGRKQKSEYRTLRDTLSESFVAPFRKVKGLLHGQAAAAANLDETIWALRDLSFEIGCGEAVGIIGANGAGKSTLLKVLSRITEPTSGYAEVHGRVGSLLEVGTGFHLELTGRENLYLNGAILGMKKAEIKKKFDEIVAFAEVDKFIDTPVKHYSSGMYLRLAFAVAAHLEPEILIVDEVLAVGDARFQKKCLKKMEDVGEEGRTVLFVSHNMPAITRLCQKAILLAEGRMVKAGPCADVVSYYLNSGGTRAAYECPDPLKAPAGDVARLRAVRVKTEEGRICDVFDIKDPVYIEMEYDVLSPGHILMPHYQFYNETGIEAFVSGDRDPSWRRKPRPSGRWISTVKIPGNYLSEGTLFVQAGIWKMDPMVIQFSIEDLVAFQVVDNGEGETARGVWPLHMGGVVRPLLEWNTQFGNN